MTQLLPVDLVRPEVVRIAEAVGTECIATAIVGGDIVIVAVAGKPRHGQSATRGGQRIPFVPPLGNVFVA